jgi:DnaJ family protein B protein 12
MEGNKDEALRCLAIAQKHFDAGNLPSARKFCLKSITLFEAPQATKLLASINKAETSSSEIKSGGSSSNSQTEEHPSAAGIKNRHSQPNTNGTAGGMGGEKRDFTPEQRTVVQRVRSCKATDYYEILGVKKDCDDAEIKKAYRKVNPFHYPELL